MLNLLRADLFRTLRSISFWIWLGVVVACLALVAAIMAWATSPEFAQLVNASISQESLQMMPPEEREATVAEVQEAMGQMGALNDKTLASVTANWANTFFDGGLLGIAAICFVVIFLLADLKHGFIKNLPMDRRGRIRYYSAKLLYVAIVQAVFLLVCAGVTTLLFSLCGFSYERADSAGDIALWLLMAWLSCVTYAYICCALAWAVRSDALGAVGAVVIGGGVLGSFLFTSLNYLGTAVPLFASLSQWLPVTTTMDLRPGAVGLFDTNPAYLFPTLPDWGHALIVSCAYIMISCLLILLVLRKRDIR